MKEFYPIDKAHSYIEFSIKYMGAAKIKGRFERFEGLFRYNESDIEQFSGSLTIDVASIDTDNKMRDSDLRSSNWFDTDKFPSIKFVTKSVSKRSDGFDIIGDLTIKNTTKEIFFKMNTPSGILTDFRKDYQVVLTGETTINRKDFGVEGKKWSAIKEGITGVESSVLIEISILGKQVNADNYRNLFKNRTKPHSKLYQEVLAKGVDGGIEMFDEMYRNTESKLNPYSFYMVGNLLLKEGKVGDALKIFRRNLEAFPRNKKLHFYYGHALMSEGILTEGKAHIKKALELDPNYVQAFEIFRHLN